jgi:hypothetical protein
VILPTLMSNFEIEGVSSTAFFGAGLAPLTFFAFCSPPAAGASCFLFSSFGFCSCLPFLSAPASGFPLAPASAGFPEAFAAFCSFYQAALAMALI